MTRGVLILVGVLLLLALIGFGFAIGGWLGVVIVVLAIGGVELLGFVAVGRRSDSR